jgi:hypothetical protein
MTSNAAEFKSGLDIVAYLHALIDFADKGGDVSAQISVSLAMLDEMECRTIEDAMGLAFLSRTLYCRAIEQAVKGDPGTIALMDEAEKQMERCLAFMEAECGMRSPTLEAWSRQMH